MTNKMRPIHPGEVLLEDFLKPMGLSINGLARQIKVPAGRISEICNGKRAVSADTALRLAKVFSTTPDVWLGMQYHYEMKLALAERRAEYDEIEPLITLLKDWEEEGSGS